MQSRDEHGKRINKFVFYIQVHSRLKIQQGHLYSTKPTEYMHIYNIKKNAIPEMQADDVRTNDSMDKQQQQQ